MKGELCVEKEVNDENTMLKHLISQDDNKTSRRESVQPEILIEFIEKQPLSPLHIHPERRKSSRNVSFATVTSPISTPYDHDLTVLSSSSSNVGSIQNSEESD